MIRIFFLEQNLSNNRSLNSAKMRSALVKHIKGAASTFKIQHLFY